MAVDPIQESPSARWSTEESAAATGELGGGEQLVSTVDESATVPGAMAKAAGSSAANAGDVDAAPESRAARPVTPEEQMVPPEASQSVVRPAVRPRNPPGGASGRGGGGRGGRD